MSNSLDLDQARHFVRPDLVANCLQRISTDHMERNGSVVECLTQDQGATGSSLTGVNVVVLEQDTILVQPRKTRPCLTERLLMERKESNQNKISADNTSGQRVNT